MKRINLIILLVVLTVGASFAGNPDRQGESGAVELLMNPWARSAGLHTLTTSLIGGVESMRLNVAGLARINKTEFVVSNAKYFEGSDIQLNGLGLAQKIGKNNYIGVSLMSVNFGDLPISTDAQPEGTGVTYSPNFFNLGIGVSHIFENKITVGILFRIISEGIYNVGASGFGIDAGVQYVAGDRDNFKFGISLRNIGTRMAYNGEGLSFDANHPSIPERINADIQSDDFELPSTLNIGLSYDIYFGSKARLTPVANFTSNAFSRDQIGGGLEFSFREMFMLRGGFRYDLDNNEFQKNIYNGASMGATVQVPFKKGSDSKFAIDYAYRTTEILNGTHNLSLRVSI